MWRRPRNTHVLLHVRAYGDSPVSLAMTHMRRLHGQSGHESTGYTQSVVPNVLRGQVVQSPLASQVNFFCNYPSKPQTARPPSGRNTHVSFSIRPELRVCLRGLYYCALKSPLSTTARSWPHEAATTPSSGRTPVGQSDDGPKLPAIYKGGRVGNAGVNQPNPWARASTQKSPCGETSGIKGASPTSPSW